MIALGSLSTSVNKTCFFHPCMPDPPFQHASSLPIQFWPLWPASPVTCSLHAYYPLHISCFLKTVWMINLISPAPVSSSQLSPGCTGFFTGTLISLEPVSFTQFSLSSTYFSPSTVISFELTSSQDSVRPIRFFPNTPSYVESP
jgi:hypothetical protein